MDFFEQQARAQRQSKLLIWLFGLAVLAVVALIYFVLASAIWMFQHPMIAGSRWNPLAILITMIFHSGNALVRPFHFLELIWNPQHAAWVTLGTLVSITAGCFYKMRLLSGGGSAVAELLGGRRVAPNTRDADEKKFRAVVEEMAIASGMPVPEIYVLDRERGINAFAAGHTREDVAIGVTFGCLKLLTRDELQGAIAHEFSHVLNGDTRLNMRLMGLAHGLFWPTIVGRVLLRGTPQPLATGESIFDDDADVGQLRVAFAPIAFVFLAVGSVGSPFVRLIKSAICREREWLADAAAVQFTRNPAGIEGALKKIGGLLKQGRLDTPYTETASHLYFANSAFDSCFGFLSTHPPLKKRILAIDPAFDGKVKHIISLPSRDAEYDRIYEDSVRRARAKAETFEAEE